ncbi:MAG: transcriptional repressor [Candidatus Melainabacteria bacterium]|nr:MAG: transcriptional repressor [Candidatus Melainabacteria bacterium]
MAKQPQSTVAVNARLTKGSQKVLQLLEKRNSLSTAQEIHSLLRNEDESAPGLTTVYRALESLVALGLVQSVELGDGEKRFELVTPGEHHHHLVCERCRESIHLDQCLVEDLESAIKTKYGFAVTGHILEIFGVCKRCK